ncbi:glycosyltransferase [Anoxybacillus flavithermus]|nr:glycosyltransferase [Anoxybacillus flavithermus]MBE2942837.1 glycosyltransferase [Anoxybacillus flavithermus]MBE2951177.1 glycosyltransferase [Anoxybacillus flavithermus]MBE2953825.1 glycosyltransferase [Anoxybacillus flavithermus]MBE2959064.1 glycosyltransferase [Anoxybacillus flavithermus]
MMEKIPFDQYQRYKHVAEIINLVREKEKYCILEVGANEHRNLEHFLPNDQITYLDIEVPKHLKDESNYIQADATDMPLKDKTFDFVIALDVFEHISNTKREKFITEIKRVAREGFIIAAPFNTEGVEEAEIRLNEYHKALYGENFRWLEEHRQNSLPQFNDTLKILRENSINFIEFEHGSLFLWEKLMRLHFLVASSNKLKNYRFVIDEFYNKYIYERDYSVPCYRKFIVSLKSAEKLEIIRSNITIRKNNSVIDSDIINKLLDLENSIKDLNLIEIQNQQCSTYDKLCSSIINEQKIGIQQIQEIYNWVSQHTQDIQNLIEDRVNLLKQVERLTVENQHLRQQIEDKDTHIRNIEAINQAIVNTKGWKYLERIRRVRNFFLLNKWNSIPKVVNRIKTKGLRETVNLIEKKINYENNDYNYDKWIRSQIPSNSVINEIKVEIEQFSQKPIISIVMPTYNTDKNLLAKAIDSVRNQIYPYWELCICDDCSSNKEVWELLEEYAKKDKRIKIVRAKNNLGIAGATNKAIELASGDYVGFLDHDDELTIDALYEVAKVINECNPDMIYSDEDKIDENGIYCEPFFKPDWSPDYILSVNYICHFAVYRKSIGDELGWLRTDIEGSQDHDLVLRFTERTEKVKHIPKVLYHWRKIPTSTAQNGNSKHYAWENGVKVVQDALNRRNIAGRVTKGKSFGHYEVRRKIDEEKLVSIIIPMRDKVELIRTCIDSIEKKTTYKNYEIIIIDNGSKEQETLEYLSATKHRVLRLDVPFNYSYLNNRAVEYAQGEYILFLNNDVEVIEPEWLTVMVEHIQRKEVGAVGAKLYYTDGRIQHAGIILGIGGVAGHSHKYFQGDSLGYFSMLTDTRNFSAVTGACLLTKKYLFNEIGGFNEKDLAVAFNDVDLCLRIREKGYLIVLPPKAELFHHESVSRGHSLDIKEVKYMKQRWGHILDKDPYYNPNLTLEKEDFSLNI